ncbi:MAG: hypothetical protein IT175_02375 [Acidobacteria bacterium]|nr:hypothetical protein [Acidobacteriota bacterium]
MKKTTKTGRVFLCGAAALAIMFGAANVKVAHAEDDSPGHSTPGRSQKAVHQDDSVLDSFLDAVQIIRLFLPV